MIVRSHHCVLYNGFVWSHDQKVISIYSAPNFAQRNYNEAAIIEVDEYMHKTIHVFQEATRAPTQSKQELRTPDHFI